MALARHLEFVFGGKGLASCQLFSLEWMNRRMNESRIYSLLLQRRRETARGRQGPINLHSSTMGKNGKGLVGRGGEKGMTNKAISSALSLNRERNHEDLIQLTQFLFYNLQSTQKTQTVFCHNSSWMDEPIDAFCEALIVYSPDFKRDGHGAISSRQHFPVGCLVYI